MKSPTEIHSNSAIELQVYHLITCYHNFCIMSLPSRQQSFPLQVKRICRDSSFVTLMSFSAKLSLPARFFSHCFGSQGRTLNYFCNRLRIAKRYVTWLVSNHDRSNSWPSNHVWKSGCIHSNEISCNIKGKLTVSCLSGVPWKIRSWMMDQGSKIFMRRHLRFSQTFLSISIYRYPCKWNRNSSLQDRLACVAGFWKGREREF